MTGLPTSAVNSANRAGRHMKSTSVLGVTETIYSRLGDEQDRQCASNIILGAFVQALLLWTSNKYCIF
jgi:hypothetical protein